ncbi:DNA polymerase III subunit delta' [Desulfonatronum sp. SC1]|nr:DNA polymerase III subunit delta' [Desulfonatronum sp. SC1]
MYRIPGQERVVGILARLLSRTPRVLLLEGGTAEEREKLALYWTALLNCTALPAPSLLPPSLNDSPFDSPDGPELPGPDASLPVDGPRPCEHCPACSRIRDGVFLDLIYLDGREGRIGIDTVRELRGLLGQAPRDAKRRVVALGEAQELTEEAANALLKSMEDTETRNAYVLLAPQRERLLRTLVSRSWVATLSWDLDGIQEREGGPDTEWGEALARFLTTGRGWFGRTLIKGQVDRPLAFHMVHTCRRGLIRACQGRPDSSLARVFREQGSPAAWRAVDLHLDEAEQALRAQVAPTLVLDWLAVGLRGALRAPLR